MELINEILNNWQTDIPGYAHKISSLENTLYPAWTLSDVSSYGVGLLYDGREEINESFANARIVSKDVVFEGGYIKHALILTASSENIEGSFAALCASLVTPGEDGKNRASILNSPLEWWIEWKELLGNKNIDPRIYDVLGELCVFKELLKQGEDISWNGPNRSSYDIEMDSRFVEVKSTIARDKREVSISNHFQLKPEGKPLWLVLCQFEPTVISGISIDGIVDELEMMGYNTYAINEKLSEMGFEQGMSARKKTFILHDMLQFTVDDSFPRVTPESFVGGVMPIGITKFTYTVDLSGMPAVSMLQGANNEAKV